MLRHVVACGISCRYLPAAVVVAIAFVSCNGTNPTQPADPEPATSFAADIQPIFDANCTTCHAIGVFGFNLTGGLEQNGLDLTPGRSYAALVGQPTFQRPEVAPTFRVAPGSPGNSYILQKLTSATPKVGEQMPRSNEPLTPAQIERIRAWIARGAPND